MTQKFKIFLTSFFLLFLELSLIRFLPAQIAYLGYYSNFILLASFIGIGIGLLLASHKRNYHFAFPWFLCLLIALSTFFSISLIPEINGEIHFTSNSTGVLIPELVLIPLVFFLVTILMSLPAQLLGRLADKNPSLEFYTMDIIGSLTGIAFFTANAYFGTAPIVWFGILILIYLLLFYEKSRRYLLATFGCLLIVTIFFFTPQKNIFWSPYQKVGIEKFTFSLATGEEEMGYRLSVNNINHQSVVQDIKYKEWFYTFPYQALPNLNNARVLVIGAGAGTDVAVALAQGAKQVDAVEIDPEILRLGQQYNPNKPYDDPRVTTDVMDARTFLERTKNKYDLIIYALPDSLILASHHGNIRLESFLFTTESFLAAKKALSNDGVLVLYNYYRQPWLIDKLASMLEQIFQQPPYVWHSGAPSYMGILMASEKTQILAPGTPSTMAYNNNLSPATDNWPFLYLQHHTIPLQYLLILLIIIAIIYIVVSLIIRKKLHQIIQPSYFFLGAAFMLLEAKSVIRFSLLFGATWLVNALVFFAILSSVLAAVLWTRQQKTDLNIKKWYYGLFTILILNYLIPENLFLSWPITIKYLTISLLTFAPIFCANIIFAVLFKKSEENAINFASNILGAAVGGILEYGALLLGYHQIILLIIVLYFLTFYLARREKLIA